MGPILGRILAISTALLALCAVLLTGTNIHEWLRQRQHGSVAPADSVENWRQYADSGHRLGRVGSAVTVVVFSDYECPVCRGLNLRLAGVIARNHESASVVWRHFPLAGHRNARLAAQMAVCADLAGTFPSAHNLLFEKADSLGFLPHADMVSMTGMADSTQLVDCLNSPETEARLQSDIAAGQNLGVVGTPTFLVNHELYIGMPRDLERIINRATIR